MMKTSIRLSQKFYVRVIALVLLFGLFISAVFTAPLAFADNSRDAVVGMTNNGFYISDAAKAKFRDPNAAASTLQNAVRDTANKKYPAAFGFLDLTNTVPADCQNRSINQCAETLRNQISKYDIVVLVYTNDTYGMSVKGLTTTESQQLIDAARNTFTVNGPAAGATALANSAVTKLEEKAKAQSDAATGNTIFTVSAIAVFLLILAGLGFFLVSRTNKNWKAEMQALKEESSKINDYIFRLSGDVDYAFGESGERLKQNFSQATLGMEKVNADLRLLSGAGTPSLIFGWGKWRNQRDETKAKLEDIRTNLAQIDREIQTSKQLPGS
jgi:hypothetical protein